jgi:hypothetical protein
VCGLPDSQPDVLIRRIGFSRKLREQRVAAKTVP